LSTEDQEREETTDDFGPGLNIPILALLTALWNGRWTIPRVAITGVILFEAIAWLLPVKFTSTASLMPPDAQTFTSSSSLTALNGSAALAPGLGGGGGLLGSRSAGATAIGILGSVTVQNDIIKRFDLLRVYHCKHYADARKILASQTFADEDKKSGVVSISVTNHDRYLARDIAQEYIDELDKLLASLSTSSARRERIFLENRLGTLKTELDATTVEFSRFSSKNATLNPQSQGQALVQSSAGLQSQLISAQAQLSSLKAMYSENNVRVRQARALVDSLQAQLQRLNGSSKSGSTDLEGSGDSLPSIRQLPLLGITYADLNRKMMIEDGIYQTLSRQYELAKVQEAKEIPALKVLDAPELPETKSFPPRTLVGVAGGILAAFGAILYIIAKELWSRVDDASPLKRDALSFIRMIRSS